MFSIMSMHDSSYTGEGAYVLGVPNPSAKQSHLINEFPIWFKRVEDVHIPPEIQEELRLSQLTDRKRFPHAFEDILPRIVPSFYQVPQSFDGFHVDVSGGITYCDAKVCTRTNQAQALLDRGIVKVGPKQAYHINDGRRVRIYQLMCPAKGNETGQYTLHCYMDADAKEVPGGKLKNSSMLSRDVVKTLMHEMYASAKSRRKLADARSTVGLRGAPIIGSNVLEAHTLLERKRKLNS